MLSALMLRGRLVHPHVSPCHVSCLRSRPLSRTFGLPKPCGRRYAATTTAEAGEDRTGHISCGPNEGIFFVDNIYPLRFRWLLGLPLLNIERTINDTLSKSAEHFGAKTASSIDPIGIVRKALPKELPINVVEIIPRIKEGGAFVKFNHDKDIDTTEIEGTLANYLRDHPVRTLLRTQVHAALVKGRPWLEDLYRFPSPRLKIEFLPTQPGGEAATLSQEDLFSLLRRYGKIADIDPQPADSKVLPKYATVTFRLPRYAIMARNCMHGFVLVEEAGGGKNGTLLKMTYEQIIKAHYIRDWVTSHPRIIIPLLAALAGAIAVAIFDPIREQFIKLHVEHTFHLENNRFVKLFKRWMTQAGALLTLRHRQDDTGLSAIWDDRQAQIDQIKTWLMETTNTFIVIQGPRGSGKKELVMNEALSSRHSTLLLDCKPIQEARGDSTTIAATARQVGYRPVFSWMNSVSSLIDLAAQGTIGVKSGFSETLDSQLEKILSTTAGAMKKIALSKRSKDDKDKELDNDQFLEAHPEHRPVVVIDNFLHKNNESSVIYDKLSQWAANCVTSNIAHIIFLTHDVSFSKALGKSLPDRVFHEISLGDCSPEVAKRYVIRHLDAGTENDVADDGEKAPAPSQSREDLSELDGSIEILGGRLTDLEFLARRIKAGETPNRAVKEIINQSASEILKMYIFDAAASRSWTPIQSWYLIKALAGAHPDGQGIRYNEVTLASEFSGSKPSPDSVLQALEEAELISIQSNNGRPSAIKPGRPVFAAAFKNLVSDNVLSAKLNLMTLGALIKDENDAVTKAEDELQKLGTLPGQPGELTDRVKWLLAKVRTSQLKIQGWEKEQGTLKAVLANDY